MILNHIIAIGNPKSPISEAYRVIRTNLQFTSLDKPLKSIVITSSDPGEGKSTTLINLAVVFAENGSKVLIVDADLRKPRLHKTFIESNRSGLTNAIINPERVLDFIHNTEVNNLSILTSGPIPPNPSELLGSLKMKELMEELKSHYDIILVDSPPVGILTDAQLLASRADGVIIVAASAEVTIEELNRSKQLLRNVNAKILGVILNKLDKQSNGRYYHYYSSYEDEPDRTKIKKRTKRARRKREK